MNNSCHELKCLYAYDTAGNRTAVQLNGGAPTTTTYNAANQISNAGFSYDNAGNLINDGTAAYTYDALNRTTARGSTTYAYNGDGTLVSQLTGGRHDPLHPGSRRALAPGAPDQGRRGCDHRLPLWPQSPGIAQ